MTTPGSEAPKLSMGLRAIMSGPVASSWPDLHLRGVRQLLGTMT